MDRIHVDDAMELIRLEYAEIPALQLSFWQAQRLWNLPDEICRSALSALIERGFLVRTREGIYMQR
jgi:hypothetical protein